MLAVDTNVVVRLLVNDDAGQHRRAVALFAAHSVWIPRTVLLETEWVLRGAYGFGKDAIAAAFDKLLRLPQVTCEDRVAVEDAVDALGSGLDFADALHVSGCLGMEDGFATFDANLVKRARKRWAALKLVVP
jgi:predicted nucleic-acid-binding protein